MRLRLFRRRASPRPAVTLGLLAALGWSLLLGSWHVRGESSLLDRIEGVSLDLRFMAVGRRTPPRDLVIVGIDDATLRAAGQYPLPRALLTELLLTLAAQQPAVVALDMLLVESRPEADGALRQALQALPAVIGAAALFDVAGGASSGPVPRASSILWPAEGLRDAAAIGSVNVANDDGGTPRHLPLLIRSPDGLLPSFALVAAALALRATPGLAEGSVTLAGRRQALDLGYHLALNFYGPRGTVPVISAQQVLRGELPDGLLRGRTLVIGTTAVGSGDTFATPFSPVMPGVEVLATGIGNLLAGDGLVRTALIRWIDAVAAGALALGAVLLISLRRAGLGLVLTAAGLSAWIAFVFGAFFQGWWFGIALPLATTLPTAMVYGAARLGLDRLRLAKATRSEEALRAFHPPAFARRLADDPAFLRDPAEQDAAVLFLDLSGFTGASEALGAVRTRDLLKSFHSVVDDEVARHRGCITAFMGDGAMALFGFPDRAPDETAAALRCALALHQALAAWGEVTPAGRLGARIGVHFGPVVVSRLGGRSHQHITATGDTVNVASRLLDLAKQMGTPLVVTEDLYLAATAVEPSLSAGFTASVAQAVRGRRDTIRVRVLTD